MAFFFNGMTLQYKKNKNRVKFFLLIDHYILAPLLKSALMYMCNVVHKR
jgi:hypothetical protein